MSDSPVSDSPVMHPWLTGCITGESLMALGDSRGADGWEALEGRHRSGRT